MRSLMDELVVSGQNEEVFQKVLGVTQAEGEPVRMLIYGPTNAGKTTLLQARGKEKDFLSTKEVMFCHAAEILSYINLPGIGDEFLNKVGSAQVLLLDGVDVFFEEANGPMVCRLLMTQRNSMGLETIAVTDKPFDEFEDGFLDRTFEGYARYEVQPLDAEGLLEFARKLQANFLKEDAKRAHLADDALEFVAKDFAQQPGDIRNAMTFLLSVANFENGSEVSLDQVKTALGVEE